MSVRLEEDYSQSHIPIYITGISSAKSEKLEQLKKKPAKRPDWNDLMKEIGQFKSGTRGILNKTSTNDRSKPMLSKTKVKGVVSTYVLASFNCMFKPCFIFLVCIRF